MKIQAYIVKQGSKKVIEGVLQLANEEYEELEGYEIIDVDEGYEIIDGKTYVKSIDSEGKATLADLDDFSDYHENRIKDEEERISKLTEIFELKKYLTDTDYVISKLNELKLEDEEEYEAAKAEYSETLKKRKEARARINELEG